MDRSSTQWVIGAGTAADGTGYTTLTAVGERGRQLSITCDSRGGRSLSMRTNASPDPRAYSWVSLRIGSHESPTDAWTETSSAGQLTLSAPAFDLDLVRQLYRNWDVMAELVSGNGRYSDVFAARGFPAAIDRTRAACNWSDTEFPPENGWGRPYPDAPPAYAKEVVYESFTPEQISPRAWVATNAYGRPQLMVRINENPAICRSSTGFDSTRFYVEQAGSRRSAMPGFHLSYSCGMKPVTLALQGEFDPSAPLLLKLVPFHSHSLSDFTYFMSSVTLP